VGVPRLTRNVSSSAFSRDERGQALIVVALAVTVLLGAVALGVDWGYGLTQRRLTQNAADSATAAVGKYLATSVLLVNGTPGFGVSQQSAWCVARNYVTLNPSTSGPAGFTLEFGSSAATPVWTTAAAPTGGICPPSGTATQIPSDTIYVRVEASVTFQPLLGRVMGQTQLVTQASARARLSGTGVPLDGPVWPMVRHYDPAEFNTQMPCPGGSCDFTQVAPMTFWSPNASNIVYGNFKGLIDLSRYSNRYAPTAVAQLVTQWDQSGSAQTPPPAGPTALLADMSGNCGGTWDTAGGEDPQNQDKQCSIPNWFYYAFRGAVSLSSSWTTLPAGQEAPSALGSRSICGTPPDPSPSCPNANVGDWLETASGNVGQNMSDNMRARINSDGTWVDGRSNQFVQNGPNKGNQYGKALTILVYLWDCAESFNSASPAGSQWSMIMPSRGPADCSQLTASGNSPTPDRVHLFTAAPFTFYEGLVTTQAIEGYWGGSFGDPASCRTCGLNPLANTAFLVPDE
jgi:putative Flp pilus-assembly TadE/G-like protein